MMSSSFAFSPVPTAKPVSTHSVPRPRVLLVSDEAPTPDSLAALLVQNGYLVFHLPLAADPFDEIIGVRPDLIVTEVPTHWRDRDGWLRRLRRGGIKTPILVVSSGHSIADRVRGLDGGADDYLEQPFHPAELLARVQALLRRGAGAGPRAGWVRFGPVMVDLQRMTTIDPRGESRLSRIECALVDLLLQARGRPVSPRQMLHAVWGKVDLPAERSVDAHVWRLRHKIGDTGDEPRWIKRVPGAGYQLECTECHIPLPPPRAARVRDRTAVQATGATT